MTKETRRELEHDDKKYLWHPFTQMRGYLKETPLIIEEGTPETFFAHPKSERTKAFLSTILTH